MAATKFTPSGAREIARVQAQVFAQRGLPDLTLIWVEWSYRKRAALAIGSGGDRTWRIDSSMR
jgi:hypothetical protein